MYMFSSHCVTVLRVPGIYANLSNKPGHFREGIRPRTRCTVYITRGLETILMKLWKVVRCVMDEKKLAAVL